MPSDQRFRDALNSLIEITRRRLLEDAVIKVPIPGGIGVAFGNTPNIPLPEVESQFEGLVVVPKSDSAPVGWGFPYDIDPPRGTPGGTHPEGFLTENEDLITALYTRSSSWFSALGDMSMTSMVGGADWQSSDSSIVLSYGSIGDSRYEKSYTTQVFKDRTLLALTPLPSGLTAVAAEISDNSLLIATVVGSSFKITKYFMTDSTLLVQDTGSPAVEILDYPFSTITASDINVSTFTGGVITNIPDRSIDLVACNFSPDADACVFTTNYGDLVEFSIAGSIVSVNEEIIIRQPQDSYFTTADLTDGIATSGTETYTLVSSDFDEFGPEGEFISITLRVVRFECLYERTSASTTGTDELLKTYKQFTFLSDYDFATNQRVDLHYEVSGSRTRTANDRDGTMFLYLSQCPYNPITEPPCTPPSCVADPSLLGSNTDPIFDIEDSAYVGNTITLKLGTTVLETFNSQNTNVYSVESDNSIPTVSDVKLGTAQRLQKIHAADLRIGFVAYEYTDESYEDRHVTVDSIVTEHVDPTITGTTHWKVNGGTLLQDQAWSEGYVEDVGTAPLDRQLTLEMQRNDPILPIELDDWKFGYAYTAIGAVPETAFYPVYGMKRFLIDPAVPIPYEDPVNMTEDSTLAQQVGFAGPDMALADTEIRDRTATLKQRYTDFTHGDEAVVTETTGTNPRVTPIGVV